MNTDPSSQQTVFTLILAMVIISSNFTPSFASTGSSTNYGSLNVDKATVSISEFEPTIIQISGTVEDYLQGQRIILEITKPDDTFEEIKTQANQDGVFSIPLYLNSNWVKGNYQLLATYGNNEIGHASFLITSVDTPNIPVFVNIGSLEIDDEEITLSGNEKSTVEVYGNIKNYEKGNPISLKVIHPDGMITDVSVTGKRIGDFKAHVSIGDAWKSGTFSIIASYDGKDFGQVNFVLNKIQIPELIQKSDSAKPQIPDWIKNNAKWWVDDTIDDKAFVGGIQFLIKEGLIQIPETVTSTIVASQEIPSWIKNNADWWSQGLIPDADFLKGIQFLVENGIIVV